MFCYPFDINDLPKLVHREKIVMKSRHELQWDMSILYLISITVQYIVGSFEKIPNL